MWTVNYQTNEIQSADEDRWLKFDSHSNSHDFKELLDAVCYLLNWTESLTTIPPVSEVVKHK